MSERHSSNPQYILGQTSQHDQLMIRQGKLLNSFTRRMLEDAGISQGMRVLDIGCGPGDVSLLAASLVGKEGRVVGVDSSVAAIARAQARAADAGFSQTSFQVADIHQLDDEQPFDAIVGRLILQHVPDPVALLRRLLTRLRTGGVVAFQEYDLSPQTYATLPASPLWEQAQEWCRGAFQRFGRELRMGMKLPGTFVAAGLPVPQLRYEAAIGTGRDWEGYEVLAAAVRAFLPAILRLGVATAEEIDIETLASRLREESVSQGGVTRYIGLVSAWTSTGVQ
ncbi:MAG: class I SAM-dependent methyltransferase [Ktedonobacteraceae bacterium]|nr:class I SAM-dependent methyltransferase [Ktedonobacteraceae bacterium]